MRVEGQVGIEDGPASSPDDELTRVLADYLAEVEAGRAVDPEEWIENHPAIADRLRICLKGLQMVEEFACAIGAGLPVGDGGGGDLHGPTLGDFRIVRALGRGGMGVVYEAVDRSLERRVALKVLPCGAAIDPRRLARFRVESHAAAGLNHPHIIPVYSVGSEAGVHYYAMQLIDGPTLEELIADLRRLRSSTARAEAPGAAGDEGTSSIASAISSDSTAFFRECARLGMEAAMALDHAHENGVLHRDIKPSNLMVDGAGHLWVADFGLARFQSDSSLTVSGDVLGTLRYMSPEQALGNRSIVDQRSDVYSLGATLYELITLRPPFEGSNRQELLRKIAQDEARRPRALRADIPLDLETIVLKAVAKEPSSRYATAGLMAEDLKRFLDDQPIRARRPRVLERATRLLRKRMAIVMAVVPLLLLMVAGLSVGILLVLAEQSQILKQQVEIRDKKIEAEGLQAKARRQRDVARRAVDEMYTLVAQDWLSRSTNLQPLQRDFLQKALEYYEEFAGEEDVEPEVRTAAGWAFYRLGDIQRRLGKLAEGERGYRQAIEALEAVGGANRPDVERLEALSGSYCGLGELLDETGRVDESKKALARAIGLRQILIAATPDTPANKSVLATRYEQLGASLGRNGQFKEAGAAFQKAIALSGAGDSGGVFVQARSISNLGITVQRRGDTAGAEQLYRQAVAQYERLARDVPGVSLYKERLAEALLNLGQSLSKQSKEVEAIFRRAQDVYRELAAGAPDVAAHRRNLATTFLNLTALFFSAGRLREAELASIQAKALLECLVAESPAFMLNQELLAQAVAWLAKIRAQAGGTITALADAKLARDLYEKLDRERIDLAWDRGWNQANLANLEDQTGNVIEANKSWRQAVALFEGLVAKAPRRLDLRADLAFNLMQLGLSSRRLGKSEEAERDLRRTVDILQRVVGDAPERTADRFRLAQAAHHFGHFLFEKNRTSEAEAFSYLAYRAYERLFLDSYRPDEMVNACADCLSNVAISQLGLGRFDDAIRSYRESLKLFDSLPPKLAFERSIRENRGKVLDNLGKALMLRGSFDEAEPRIRQGLSIRESLLAEAPKSPSFQDALGLSSTHSGEILARRGQAEGARRLLKRGVELEQQALARDPRFALARGHLRGARKSLAFFLLDQGDYADAAAVSEDLWRDASGADLTDLLTHVASFLAECAFLAANDQRLPDATRQAAASPYAKRALEAFERAAADKTTTGPVVNLAWFRLACPAVALRDVREALRLAKELTANAPARADSWSILGAALYYHGDQKSALGAFEKARQLDPAKFGAWDFYAAMAHLMLGEKSEAKACYDRAERWIKQNRHSKTHERIQSEASTLLNLRDPAAHSGSGQHMHARVR
jgi:eukaryotic-like serine/threonine-protein kinase